METIDTPMSSRVAFVKAELDSQDDQCAEAGQKPGAADQRGQKPGRTRAASRFVAPKTARKTPGRIPSGDAADTPYQASGPRT